MASTFSRISSIESATSRKWCLAMLTVAVSCDDTLRSSVRMMLYCSTTHTDKFINQPALHLKPLLLLNFACTASSDPNKLPITMQCRKIDSSVLHPTPKYPDTKGPSKPHDTLRKKKLVISHLHHPVVSRIVHLGNTLDELPEP